MSTIMPNTEAPRPPPPDFLSGSFRAAKNSMVYLGETVGVIDSDSDEDDKKGVQEEEERNQKELPEDTLQLPDAEYHRMEMLAKKKRLKEKRKMRMAAGATGGAVVGALIMLPVFPLGMALGGAGGAGITKWAHKHHEKKKLKKLDQKLMAQNEHALKVEETCIS